MNDGYQVKSGSVSDCGKDDEIQKLEVEAVADTFVQTCQV